LLLYRTLNDDVVREYMVMRIQTHGQTEVDVIKSTVNEAVIFFVHCITWPPVSHLDHTYLSSADCRA